MWIAAAAAIALIYFTQETRDDGRTVDASESPLYEAGRDRARGGSRRALTVEDDEGSIAVYRSGRRHTGRTPYRGPARVARAWRYHARGTITAQPVVGDDGTIYIGTHERELHAIAPDGTRRWKVRTYGPVWESAAVLGDTIYIGSDANAFFALDAANGRSRWRIRTEGDADGAVSVAKDGSLRFTAGRDLYAVTREGRVRWRFRARGSFLLSAPAMDSDSTAYIGSLDDHVYAIAADGRMRWSYRTGGDVSSSPVIGDDGTIYFGSDDRHVHAIDRDGRLRWRSNVGGYVRAPVALGLDGSVIAGVYGPEPRVVSLDAADGELRWYFPVGVAQSTEVGVASGPLVDADGNIYFGAQDDFVYSLSREGAIRWIHRTGGDIDSTPILTADGVLVIGCDDGFLYALAERGEEPDGGSADGGPSQ